MDAIKLMEELKKLKESIDDECNKRDKKLRKYTIHKGCCTYDIECEKLSWDEELPDDIEAWIGDRQVAAFFDIDSWEEILDEKDN
jgi:hypothetical protein